VAGKLAELFTKKLLSVVGGGPVTSPLPRKSPRCSTSTLTAQTRPMFERPAISVRAADEL
jgi:hypothetical protein